MPLVVDPRLAETHRGDWETRLFGDIIREEPVTWRHYREHPESFRFPGGESLADQQIRVLSALADVARDGRSAAVVTHGGSIRLVRCFLTGRGVEDFHRLGAHNASVVEIEGGDLEGRIAAFLALPLHCG